MVNCINCGTELTDKFCSSCGQAKSLKRIDKHYVSHELLHVLHFERGIFYSMKELLYRPGHSIREFIDQDRNKHMKPVPFLIVTSLIFTLVAHLLHAEDIYNDKEKLLFGDSTIGDIQHWVQTHYGYGNIVMGVFIAMWLALIFRKQKYNFFEIIILLCFVMGQGMILLTVETFFISLLNVQWYKIILTVIAIAYPTWAIGQFFGGSKILRYVKSFLAYMLGYLSFYAAIILVGLTVDFIIGMLSGH